MAGGNCLWMVIVEPMDGFTWMLKHLVGSQVSAGQAKTVDINSDFTLFAGLKQVIAVISADEGRCPC